jgi:hypothetical protein
MDVCNRCGREFVLPGVTRMMYRMKLSQQSKSCPKDFVKTVVIDAKTVEVLCEECKKAAEAVGADGR